MSVHPDDRSDKRRFLRAALATAAAAAPVVATPQDSSKAPRVKGPPVWLDLDQSELDDAYDQSKYAPNLQQILRRFAVNSDQARAQLGAPRRVSYGATPIEALDIYRAPRDDAPVAIFLHGGAWRTGLARDYAFPAELFVRARPVRHAPPNCSCAPASISSSRTSPGCRTSAAT